MKRRSEPSRAARSLAGAAIGGALLFASPSASAFCRTASCPTKDAAWQVCTPSKQSDCGTPLYWANRCVGFTLQKDASAQVSLADAERVFQQAFETWMGADCGGGLHPSIHVEYQGTVECDAQEYNQKKRNANIIVFRDDVWPYANQGTVLALTTVTYNLETSEIYDADMELNSANISVFTLGNDGVKYDLLSIATHEAGHFLGLAHSPNSDATMFTDYKVGTTFLRDLTLDDVAGICAAYPPLMPKSSTCDPEPRHGFSPECGKHQEELSKEELEEELAQEKPSGGCAVSGPSAPSGTAGAALFAALALLGLARPRKDGSGRTGRPAAATRGRSTSGDRSRSRRRVGG